MTRGSVSSTEDEETCPLRERTDDSRCVHLVNTTPLTAELAALSTASAAPMRRGLVVAKATFRGLERGLVLDADAPEPLRSGEEPHPLGVLPADVLARGGAELEVAVLGSACAPGGVPVTEMRVSMAVGARSEELVVVGPRRWLATASGRRPGPAEPFVRMPLTWSRAYGGSAEVLVDDGAVMAVEHAQNPEGAGFDVEKLAGALRSSLGSPARAYPEAVRGLPNVERPESRIEAWDDDPEPVGWAPLAVSHPLRRARHDRPSELYSAAPGWILPPASGPLTATLLGMSPRGELRLRFPDLNPTCDVFSGSDVVSVALRPALLLVRPDEDLATITYRAFVEWPVDTPQGRSARLRCTWKGALR